MSSPITSLRHTPSTVDELYNMVSHCCGLTALLQAYAVDHGGNDVSAGHLLSGLGMLQLVLDDLQERLDPGCGVLAARREVNNARH